MKKSDLHTGRSAGAAKEDELFLFQLLQRDRLIAGIRVLFGQDDAAKAQKEGDEAAAADEAEAEKAHKDAVKKNILAILEEKYGMEEEDFLSAELEIVPAEKARDCGLDRSMIMGYGQDDRVWRKVKQLASFTINRRRNTCVYI